MSSSIHPATPDQRPTRRRRWAVRTGATIAVAGMLVPGIAAADPPEAIPGGPYVTENQNVSISSLTTYEDLTRELTGIANRNDDVEVESIGVSSEGRDIWLAKVGDPTKTPVMIINQQHGDEPHGAEASLDLIKKLSTGSGRAILDELYVLVVPRVNVDGAEIQEQIGTPERGNTDYDAPRLRSSAGIYTTELGDLELWSWDINRYHFATPAQSDLLNWNDNPLSTNGYPANPVPEAVAVLDTYFEYGPIWVVDVHNQGFHVVDPDPDDDPEFYRDGHRTTAGILWSLNDDVAPEAIEFSKQMAVAMKLDSLQYGHMEVTRYNSSSGDANIARNAYALYGTERLQDGEPGPLGGTLLVEIDGQTEGNLNSLLGQKRVGMLKKNAINL
ncbi:MAG TPA: M14 family zinc carboxypeptidase, partial [Nitriliruptoraceae bacterium]|nr:M14 family zinc carboxypeptidase [Nitriliruptoraceae bacterium]